MPEASQAPTRVDPEVSLSKFQKEVESFVGLQDQYRQRGWILESAEFPLCLITLLWRIGNLVFAPVALRIDFTNYDLWAPSLTFVDPLTREPVMPAVGAVLRAEGREEQLIVPEHPLTHLPFLCVPGTREYHSHPQHSGDRWELHRSTGEGNLATLVDRVWGTMIQTIVGLATQSMLLRAPDGNLASQVHIGYAQIEFQSIPDESQPFS